MDVYLLRGKIGCLHEVMLQRDKQDYRQTGNHCKESCQKPASFQPFGTVTFSTGQQDGEYIKHNDTTGVNHNLDRAQKGVAQQEVDTRCAEKHEEQVSSRADNALVVTVMMDIAIINAAKK